MKKTAKILVMIAAVVLIVALTAAGTFAILNRESGAVENTFTVGTILTDSGKFELKEHKAVQQTDGTYTLDTATEVQSNSYVLLPGVNVQKDPFLRITDMAANTPAYLFVEVVDNTGTSVTATVDPAKWTKMDGTIGKNGGQMYAYTTTVSSTDDTSAIKILQGDVIEVGSPVTPPASGDFKLTFYGYLLQATGFSSAAAAWNAEYGS